MSDDLQIAHDASDEQKVTHLMRLTQQWGVEPIVVLKKWTVLRPEGVRKRDECARLNISKTWVNRGMVCLRYDDETEVPIKINELAAFDILDPSRVTSKLHIGKPGEKSVLGGEIA